MGITKVSARVQSSPKNSLEVEFLVDSGAVYSVLPPAVWKKIRLKPKRRWRFSLADGTTIERGLSECHFTLPQADGTSPVVLGEGKDVALMGVVTLEVLGLVFNPFDRTLKPMHLYLV